MNQDHDRIRQPSRTPSRSPSQGRNEVTAQGSSDPGSELIPVDGFRQVVEMLRSADTKFRDSLLRRLAARDRELVKSLLHELNLGR